MGTRRPARPEERVFAEGHAGDGERAKQSGVQGVKAMEECLRHSLQVTFEVHCTTTYLSSLSQAHVGQPTAHEKS